jgi:hypothetical protein
LATIGEIALRPILLISTGTGTEQRWVRQIYAAASGPKALWEIPRARHGEGLFLQPEIYRRKLTEFFDQALGVEG